MQVKIVKNIEIKIAEEMLKLLKNNSFKFITVELILKKLRLPKKKIPNNIRNKNDLLKNLNNYFDNQILAKISSIEKSHSRDMMFEILMIRFDLLNRYRNSVIKIFNFLKKNPKNFISLIPGFVKSVDMMARSSNINTKGIIGRIKLKGLIIIYFSSFITWVKDESSSLDKTMKVLDNYLKKAEYILIKINK